MCKSFESSIYNPFRFSVVIPTYQREKLVTLSVKSLNTQDFIGNFEVIVVIDGSRDYSAEALRSLSTSFPLKVIEQSNQGASAARNKGAAAARGEIILFLDDDMEAHSHLLAEHNRSHLEGADAVIGHIPLHPDSPKNFLSYVVGLWADSRIHELSSIEGKLPFNEIMTGQLSISRKIFWEMGGFNTQFTKGGSFGNEDLDFGLRLQESNYKVAFNPKATSWQKYVVTPRQYLKQYRQAGRADVLFARIHPDQTDHLFHRPQSWADQYIWRWFRWLLRWLVLTLIDLGLAGSRTARLFAWLVNLEYYQGVREAGGIPEIRPFRIFCYHSISDLKGAPIVEEYGIPPKQFRQQLKTLKRLGFHFIDAEELIRFFHGKGGVPQKAALITFDDCYQDILDNALPILKEMGIPAVAFAISQCLGGSNQWDVKHGAPQMKLLDAVGLKELEQGGIEIGTHSRTHPMLNQISPEQVFTEVVSSIIDLKSVGLKTPRLLAYPYGEYDEVVQQVVQSSNIKAAFTVEPRLVTPASNHLQVPRIEIFRKDSGLRFIWKILRG
jgi:glycosyltransferase involved in cell wall biosynthesis/peptidoglycan/xylan/chitin deacetylase (PgdA/CDA1 family)